MSDLLCERDIQSTRKTSDLLSESNARLRSATTYQQRSDEVSEREATRKASDQGKMAIDHLSQQGNQRGSKRSHFREDLLVWFEHQVREMVELREDSVALDERNIALEKECDKLRKHNTTLNTENIHLHEQNKILEMQYINLRDQHTALIEKHCDILNETKTASEGESRELRERIMRVKGLIYGFGRPRDEKVLRRRVLQNGERITSLMNEYKMLTDDKH